MINEFKGESVVVEGYKIDSVRSEVYKFDLHESSNNRRKTDYSGESMIEERINVITVYPRKFVNRYGIEINFFIHPDLENSLGDVLDQFIINSNELERYRTRAKKSEERELKAVRDRNNALVERDCAVNNIRKYTNMDFIQRLVFLFSGAPKK